MKAILLFSVFMFIAAAWCHAQDEAASAKKNNSGLYFTLNAVSGMPVQDFWDIYEKKNLWGFNMDLVLSPIKNAPFWQPGAMFEFISGGRDKASWNGLELATDTYFLKLNVVNRFRFLGHKKVSPYVELGYGALVGRAESSYEIVDKATFFEKFFFDAEDQVETYNAKEFDDVVQNLSLGGGLIINRLVHIQVKYVTSPALQFVQRDDVKVSSTSIDYKITKSPMQMVVVSVGISMEKFI